MDVTRTRRMAAAILALAVGAGAAGAPDALARRAPTHVEKATIMDAFNEPGRSWASRCVRVLVSRVDARYAIVTAFARPPKACVDNGEGVADGFVLLVRATPRAVVWRNAYEGSIDVPCRIAPEPVRRELLGTVACAGAR